LDHGDVRIVGTTGIGVGLRRLTGGNISAAMMAMASVTSRRHL
jgi:hypothetical protein